MYFGLGEAWSHGEWARNSEGEERNGREGVKGKGQSSLCRKSSTELQFGV